MDLNMRDWALADPDELRAIPGVLGTGFGVRVEEHTGEVFPLPVVKVFVAEKIADERIAPGERVPRRLAVRVASASGAVHVFDLATDVVSLGFTAAAPPVAPFPRQARAGDSVLAPGGEVGTAGCVATRRGTGERVLVTCHHVVFPGSGPRAPGPVPPGRTLRMNVAHRDGTASEEEVAQVVASAFQDTPFHLDVAVARITRPESADGPVRELRRLPRHPRSFVPDGESLMGRRLLKSGAASRVTCGTVTGRAVELTLPGGRVVRDVLVVEYLQAGACGLCPSPHAPAPIATDVDSGAVFITDEAEPRLAGLLWGGNRQRIAFATPWATIERIPALDVTIT